MNLNCRSFLSMLYMRQEGIAHQLSAQAITALALLIGQSSLAGTDLMVRLMLTENPGLAMASAVVPHG